MCKYPEDEALYERLHSPRVGSRPSSQASARFANLDADLPMKLPTLRALPDHPPFPPPYHNSRRSTPLPADIDPTELDAWGRLHHGLPPNLDSNTSSACGVLTGTSEGGASGVATPRDVHTPSAVTPREMLVRVPEQRAAQRFALKDQLRWCDSHRNVEGPMELQSQLMSASLDKERRYWARKLEDNRCRLAAVRRRNRGSGKEREGPRNGALDPTTPNVPNVPVPPSRRLASRGSVGEGSLECATAWIHGL